MNSSQKSLGDSDPTPPAEVLVVDFEGPEDPENPKNWAYKKKWVFTIVVSLYTFISPVSSSMIAPATGQVAKQYGVTNSVEIAMLTSTFVLAYAIGPFFLGPLSEIYGRARILQFANLFYFVWNLACAWAPNKSAFIAFRFLSGFGGSAPMAVGAGVLGDIWRAEERGKAMAIYGMAPLLGPVVGPVTAAWIAQYSTWQWVFWSTSIFTALIQLIGLFLLRESFAPVILERKAERLREAMDSEKLPSQIIRTSYQSGEDRTWQTIFRKGILRPFTLLFNEPIIIIIATYMTFLYGVFYIFLTTITEIYATVYNQKSGIAGLHYIALGIGMVGVSQVTARTMDKVYVWLKNRNGGVGEPEFRVPSMVPGSLLTPFGLLLAGWAAEKHLHWIAVDFGLGLVGGGMILGFLSMQTYVVDAFTLYAASAMAAVSSMRAMAGFAFPLFAPQMYKKLGYGWGDTLLALLAIVLGCPAPFVFWKYGKRIRSRSKHAQNK